jgi:hypothetical protein
VRRRRRTRVAITAAFVVAALAVAVGIASSAPGKNRVQVSVTPTTLVSEPTTSTTNTTTTSQPSAPAASTLPTSQATLPLPLNGPTTPRSAPWLISATSELTNLAPVTISATGIASGSYYVGQCPAGQTPNLNTCALNDVVTVSDGTMTSTVHVLWWLQNGQIDCGSAPGACVVGVVNAQTAATVVSFPIAFDPTRHPTISVTPNDSLVDGQSVVVAGADLGAGTMQIEECLLPQWGFCTAIDAQTQPDGTFSIPMTVHRQLQWGGHGAGSATCGIDGNCVVEVWMTPTNLSNQRIWINPNQPVALTFAPPTTTTPTT